MAVKSGGRKFLGWRGLKHLPTMGTLLRIDAPLFVREPRSERPIDGEAPMEPPVGYGLTHRVPSSRSPIWNGNFGPFLRGRFGGSRLAVHGATPC